MRRDATLAGLLFFGLLSSASMAQAQSNLPWCLELQRSSVFECNYHTLDSCLATRAGEGGECIPNPTRT